MVDNEFGVVVELMLCVNDVVWYEVLMMYGVDLSVCVYIFVIDE